MNPSTFRTNLKTLLDARANLTSIDTQVFKYPPGAMGDTRPTIFLTEISTVQEDATLATAYDKTYTVEGRAYTEVAGAEEAKWATAESQASTLITELESTLKTDQTVSGACTQARLTSWTLAPRAEEGSKRVFMDVEFALTVRHVA